MMSDGSNDDIRGVVRETYGKIAREGGSCGCAPSACGGPASLAIGYTEADRAAVPDGADMGLGCGNPQAIAALREGETVLDLGSGGGFDAFLAARQVGPTGTVIGVDMTPDMIAKARANAAKIGASNVEFRLGEIERMPVADSTVDVIISNCVINLSPDKAAVFREAFRVLRPGGRLAIADVVATAPMPELVAKDVAAYTSCIAGAAPIDELRAMLAKAGFAEVRVDVNEASREAIRDWFPGSGAERFVVSATIEAIKAGASACCAPGCCE
jgi:arsenite methyltransferase